MVTLNKALRWSPDGIRVETLPAGEYETASLPARALEIAAHIGIVSQPAEAMTATDTSSRGRKKA